MMATHRALAYLAIGVAGTAGQVGGCYFERDGNLRFAWDDGDAHAIPAKAFRQGDA